MNILNIGKDFSEDPSGRYYSDGDGNGEDFRENYLLPRLINLTGNEKLKILLDDGVEAYGSSFLTEGFAGIVKYGYFEAEELLNKIEIEIESEMFEFYRNRIVQYINEAQFGSEEYEPTIVESV